MESIVFLEKIVIDPPRAKIYQRLGFKKRTTQIPVNRRKETDRFIDEAVSIISLTGIFTADSPLIKMMERKYFWPVI